MNSLIANQVNTNICLVYIKFFIVFTTFVPVFTLSWYNNTVRHRLALLRLTLFQYYALALEFPKSHTVLTMHQPKVMYYIAKVYTMYLLFVCSDYKFQL